MQTIVQTVATVMSGRIGEDALRPISHFKNHPQDHPYRKALQRVNIVLAQVTKNNQTRYALASAVFNREVKSTYELTVAEVKAFLSVAHPEGGITVHPGFLKYLYNELETIYEQQF